MSYPTTMNLNEICPRKAKIFLSATQKHYTLRPISLEDELWLNERFGSDLEKILNEGRIREVAAIAYHQMEVEDKEDFLAQDVTVINELGEKDTIRLGGEKLLYSLICGPSEKIELYKALMITIGISQPIVDQIQEKKNQQAVEKILKDTGKRRSTSLQKNTAGQRNIR